LNIRFLDNAPIIEVDSIIKDSNVEANYIIERYPWKSGFNTNNWSQYNLVDIINDDPNISLNNSLRLDKSYISKISPFTKVSNVKSNINTDFKLELRDRNNNILNDNDSVGTGTSINVLDSNDILLYTYVILIYGDIDGDGNIKATDYVRIKNHIMEVLSISLSIELISGDVNRDGRISSNDYVLIKNSIMNENLPIAQ
jgi:hypothetical protein